MGQMPLGQAVDLMRNDILTEELGHYDFYHFIETRSGAPLAHSMVIDDKFLDAMEDLLRWMPCSPIS